jgi:hypothetical protein
MRWTTPALDFGLPGAVKTVTGLMATGRGGALSVTVRSDEKAALKTLTLPDAAGTARAAVRIRSRRFSLEISNPGGSAVELASLTVTYEKEEDI